MTSSACVFHAPKFARRPNICIPTLFPEACSDCGAFFLYDGPFIRNSFRGADTTDELLHFFECQLDISRDAIAMFGLQELIAGVLSWQIADCCCDLGSHQLVIQVIVHARIIFDMDPCGNGADCRPVGLVIHRLLTGGVKPKSAPTELAARLALQGGVSLGRLFLPRGASLPVFTATEKPIILLTCAHQH